MNITNKNVSIFALAAFVLLIAAYANHFNNGFHFDDYHTIVNNVFIRNLKNIPSFFVDPKMFSADPSHWGLRSLVTTSLAVDYWLGNGLNPFWFQFSTFFWHIILCVILFFLYRALYSTSFTSSWPAYLAIAASSWYALHTVNAETLNYIISRSDVLSTLMIVLSLFLFVSLPAKRKYGWYIIPAVIGVFAKETVAVLVILIFFYIVIFERKLSIADLFRRSNFKIILKVLWQILPLTLAVVVTQFYTLSRISAIPGISNPLLPYLLTQTYVWLHYFIAFFLPLNLSADSDWSIIPNYFDERIIIGFLFVITLVVTILKTSSKAHTRPIAFGLIWFAAALLPTSLAPFAEVTNDHRMYFPFIGLTLSIVCYAGILLQRYQPGLLTNKRYVSYLLVFVFCVLTLNAFGVYERNKVWKTEESLWLDVTIKSPANGRGYMNYGLTQMNKGNYPIAEAYFKAARHYIPNYTDLYINMGVLDEAMHKMAEAEQNFKTAEFFGPNEFSVYAFYGQYLMMNGRINDAKQKEEKALQLNPYSVPTLNMLTRIYNQLHQWQQLQNTARQLLAILPEDKNAKAYLNAAQKQVPLDAGSSTVNLPVTPEDYLNLSFKYYNSGMYEKCIEACNEALKIKPDYADAYNNIAASYIKLKQWEKSVEASKKALALNPSHKVAQANLDYAESQLSK